MSIGTGLHVGGSLFGKQFRNRLFIKDSVKRAPPGGGLPSLFRSCIGTLEEDQVRASCHTKLAIWKKSGYRNAKN